MDKFKKVFKNFVDAVKLIILLTAILSFCVSSVIALLWSKTSFNYPGLIAIICLVIWILDFYWILNSDS